LVLLVHDIQIVEYFENIVEVSFVLLFEKVVHVELVDEDEFEVLESVFVFGVQRVGEVQTHAGQFVFDFIQAELD